MLNGKNINFALLGTMMALSQGAFSANAKATHQLNLPSWVTSQPWVASAAVGPVWENAGNQQSLYLAPEIEKAYSPNKSNHALTEGEFFLGMQKKLNDSLLGQFGLGVETVSKASLSGEIWDDADPTFNNFVYRYSIIHTHIALKGKLLLDKGYEIKHFDLIPWVSGSVAVGFNKSYDFSNTPTISEAVETPNFTGNTITAFSYNVGAGFQHTLNKNWQLGIGYEFADWGKSKLGLAPGQTTQSAPSLSHLYTNGFLLNLTYLA